MYTFILKRVLFYVISVPLLILLVLFLTNKSIIDPVERLMNLGEFVPSKEVYQKLYKQSAESHHLNLPIFYGSIVSHNYSKDFFSIEEKKYRQLAAYFLDHGARYRDVSHFLELTKEVESQMDEKDLVDQNVFYSIFRKKEYPRIAEHLSRLPYLSELYQSHSNVLRHAQVLNKWRPKWIWHGKKNQFHQYISGILRGNFGRSYVDNQPIKTKLLRALQYTLMFVFMGVALALPLSIWWGKISTIYEKKLPTRIVQFISYLFYATPMFWLCTLLLVFFTTDEYLWFGKHLSTPKSYMFNEELSPIRNILILGGSFVLPIIAIFLHNFAIFGRQIKTLLSGELEQPYMLTAKMKGLSYPSAVRKHAFGNIRIQIITIVSAAITGLFGGNVVIEYIFNIPGIGRLTYESVKSGDIPMLLAIVLLMFTITTVLYGFTDYLYRKYNPKIELA